jgi:hypothetical protein
LIALALVLQGCDKPAPTELVQSPEERTDYELLNDPAGENYYTSGVDTSGVTQDFSNPDLVNLISLTGVKITANGSTQNYSLAQAFFFDKSKPIYNYSGQVIAYETWTPGLVYFDGIIARMVDHKIRYHDNGILKETIIGKKYFLWSGIIDPYVFPYNSSSNFKLIPTEGDSVMFPIQTPKEITGSVLLNGHKDSHDLKATLHWNAGQNGRVLLIIGLIEQGHFFSIPVYKIRTADDGEFTVPTRLINKLPLNRFAKIVITLVRAEEKIAGKENNLLFISAQSIHSIVLDIP